jgi:hypothetical protein
MSCSLEDQDQVVGAATGEVGGVGLDEPDAAIEARLAGVAAGVLDRSRVEVEAVDVRAQEGLGDCKRGGTLAAADVGHAGVAGCLEPGDHVGHRREPVDRQLIGEGGPVDAGIELATAADGGGYRVVSAERMHAETVAQLLALRYGGFLLTRPPTLRHSPPRGRAPAGPQRLPLSRRLASRAPTAPPRRRAS